MKVCKNAGCNNYNANRKNRCMDSKVDMAKKNYGKITLKCIRENKNCIGFKNIYNANNNVLCEYKYGNVCVSEICKANAIVLELKKIGVKVEKK
jgi:hypothetical protein